jgi:hypothetical protein
VWTVVAWGLATTVAGLLKCVILPIHKAQVLSYMRLLDVPLGLLINFHDMKVTDGVHRLILPGAGL